MAYVWQSVTPTPERPHAPASRVSAAGIFTLQVLAAYEENGSFAGCRVSLFARGVRLLEQHVEPVKSPDGPDAVLDATLLQAQQAGEMTFILMLYSGLAPADQSNMDLLDAWRAEAGSPEYAAQIAKTLRQVEELIQRTAKPQPEETKDE